MSVSKVSPHTPHPGLGQHHQVKVGIVRILFDRFVGQQRPKFLLDRGQGQVSPLVAIMADGDIAACARFMGNGEANDIALQADPARSSRRPAQKPRLVAALLSGRLAPPHYPRSDSRRRGRWQGKGRQRVPRPRQRAIVAPSSGAAARQAVAATG